MFGIQARLTCLFVVIVTVVLGISGTWAQHHLAQELETGDRRLREGVLMRLQASLPSALWDLDQAKADELVAAEMMPPEVTAIRVYDTAVGMFAGRRRTDDGRVVAIQPHDVFGGTPVAADLVFRQPPRDRAEGEAVVVGSVFINFSSAAIEERLAGEIRRKVTEVLLLDALLVLALALSLRIVFKPLRQLRDGLAELARRDSDEVAELPEGRNDELGAVIRGFNAIQRRVRAIIGRTREAEDEARRAAQETAQALHELKDAQESLLQAERLASLGALVAGVAHEINTPVGIALTSASVLKEATDGIRAAITAGAVKKSDMLKYIETADEGARLIMNNAYRAAHLIHSFKQIAVDQVSEARRRFVLDEYIDEVVSSLQPRLKKTHLALAIDCPPGIVLDSYPGALAQVLTNLTLNCVDHAFAPDQHGSIAIRARTDGDWIEVDVTDDGRGIPATLIDRVFDPFVTTRRGQGGTGLGLNIVYNVVVQQFGGAITVASTEGQGASFVFRMPRVTPDKAPAGEPVAVQ